MTSFTITDGMAVPSTGTTTDIPAHVLTYADLIDHLVYNVAGGAQDTEQRDYRVAIQNAYREVANNFDWQYYYTHGRINLNGSYSTGTVTSSGTTVTLTSGTWPTWAGFGRLQVGDVVYPVASRTSNSVIVLATAPLTAFSADTYTLFESFYSLPNNFRGLHTPQTESGTFMTGYIPPHLWLTRERVSNNGSTPRQWTILADPDQQGAMSLVVEPYPTSDATLDFIYQRTPRRLRLTGQETASRAGTIAVSAGSQTVTGTSTTFDATMVGSILRIGTSSNYPDGDGGLNPYTEQAKIISYTSAASISVYPAINTAVSGVKYTISDPVDCWQGMVNALLRRCELELAIARGRDMGVAQAAYQQAIIQARENDALVLDARVAGNYDEPGFMWAYPSAAI